MAPLIRGGRRTVRWSMRVGLIHNVLFVLAVATVLVLMVPGTVYSAVSVAQAELGAGVLRIDGTALPNRTITVDGVAMGYSDADGAFRLEQRGYVAPGDCTVDVNDGWAGPAEVRLSGCTVNRAP
jgi:hypothetical protein